VSEKLKHLREALAEQTTRREAVEQQAVENAKRRSKLEAAIEENQRSQHRFGQLLEESEQQVLASEQGGDAGQLNLTGRRRALLEVSSFVADKLVRLKKALAEETKRSEAVEREIAENAKRRTELETGLREIQRVQDAFQGELETAVDPKQLLELESSLSENQQAAKGWKASWKQHDANRGPPVWSSRQGIRARREDARIAGQSGSRGAKGPGPNGSAGGGRQPPRKR
jgi:chromosome segregation ATPase